jgi:DNA helicase-2/ATP-dependent DNA helicase PcrA
MDAALLVSAFDRKSDGGHWEQWIDDQSENGEHLRFSYVASSRPKHLLAWAIPGNGNLERLIDLGFTVTSLNPSDR